MAYRSSRGSGGRRAGGYSRSSRRNTGSYSRRRVGGTGRTRARSASRGRTAAARPQTLRIVIENPGAPTAGRAVPTLFQRALNPVPGVAEKAPRKARL